MTEKREALDRTLLAAVRGSFRRARSVGWSTGLEPATAGTTIQGSTVELRPPFRRKSRLPQLRCSPRGFSTRSLALGFSRPYVTVLVCTNLLGELGNYRVKVLQNGLSPTLPEYRPQEGPRGLSIRDKLLLFTLALLSIAILGLSSAAFFLSSGALRRARLDGFRSLRES